LTITYVSTSIKVKKIFMMNNFIVYSDEL